MNGSIEECISEQDMGNVRKLREMVKDQLTPYYDTNFNLLRWLHGHNNNFGEIVPKLRNHLVLRRSQMQLDTLADGPRNHPVHKHWETGLTSEAVLIPNCLVNVEQTGSNDYWGILHAFPVTEVLKARIYDLEMMLRRVMVKEKERGRQHSILYVLDLTGLKYDRNMLTLLRGPLSSISAFMSEHYVELIHAFVLVNAPNFISTIWSIAKPLLPERTRNKVQILGHSSWRKEILLMSRPEALPTFWNTEGGEKQFLCEVKRSAPVDPASLYKPDPQQQKALTPMTVAAGKATVVQVQAAGGETIRWQMEADGHFSFGVYFCPTAEDQQGSPTTMGVMNVKGPPEGRLVYPRINNIPGPTYVPIEDRLVCEDTGTYKLLFSNEHAWIHSLKLRYRITKE